MTVDHLVLAQKNVLMQLHLSGGGLAGRDVITRAVDDLCAVIPQWRATKDRLSTQEGARDRIDDAIAWRVWGISGPTLSQDLDITVSEVVDIINARASLALGELKLTAATLGVPQSMVSQWCSSNTPTLPGWILSTVGLDESTPYVSVALWVAHAIKDPSRAAAVRRVREVGGVGGSLLDRLDEITPVDLAEGGKSVVAVLEAASRRILRDTWAGPEELAGEESWESRLPKEVTRIRHFSRLYAEGAELKHCVGTHSDYAHGIVERRHDIMSISCEGERATAQVSRGTVVQCKGRMNITPSIGILSLAKEAAVVAAGSN